MQYVTSRGNSVREGYMEFSVLAAQFFCNSKTSKKVY